MKQPSRFRDRVSPAIERLHNFVALDNLTSQMPLIEVMTKQRRIRIWVSYDLERVCGTYIDAMFNGKVVCVTRYAAGNTVEKINRPEDENVRKRRNSRLHKKSKQRAKNRRPKQAKRVHGRKKHARAKNQGRNAGTTTQKYNGVRSAKTVQGKVARVAKTARI